MLNMKKFHVWRAMFEEEIERKIAVIFVTDVVGYSKHMEADESGTIKNLRACEKILTALFEKHKGRLFNSGGVPPGGISKCSLSS